MQLGGARRFACAAGVNDICHGRLDIVSADGGGGCGRLEEGEGGSRAGGIIDPATHCYRAGFAALMAWAEELSSAEPPELRLVARHREVIRLENCV